VRIYFDSCAFIEAFETSTDIAAVLIQYLDSLRRDGPIVVTSELTVAEVLQRPLREGSERTISFYEGFLRSTQVLEVVPISRSVLVKAAELRAQGFCSKLPDAIHVSTAVDANCNAFVTNDARVRLPSPIRLVGYDERDLLHLLSNTA
jgi:predicted nucleic acid-binding protein